MVEAFSNNGKGFYILLIVIEASFIRICVRF
jgi:hypothetical protein